METLKFKTNIKCSGCVAQVTPHLEASPSIKEWNVDIANPDKVLTVKAENIGAEEIKAIVQKAGYNAEELS
jgi:Copper chaperone